MRTKHSRRAFLASTGTVLAATLAGCSGDTEGDSAEGSKDSTTKDKASGSKDSTTTSTEETTNEESTTEQTTTTTKEAKKALEIVEHEAYEEDYSSGVKGVVQNNGGEELSYVEVDVKFMDSEGTLLTTGMDNVNNLSAGQKWKFDAMYSGTDSFDDYQIEVSSGF